VVLGGVTLREPKVGEDDLKPTCVPEVVSQRGNAFLQMFRRRPPPDRQIWQFHQSQHFSATVQGALWNNFVDAQPAGHLQVPASAS
jgi:hypothetical protein